MNSVMFNILGLATTIPGANLKTNTAANPSTESFLIGEVAPEYQEYMGSIRFWTTILVIVIVIALIAISSRLFNLYKKKILAKEKDKRVAIQRNTTTHFIAGLVKAAIIILAIILILQVNGVNVTSLVAGLGIVSAIVGLALQDVIKDIVTGFHLVSDHYFGIGDVIQFDGSTGEVINMTLRSTTMRDLATDNILTIANRNFSKVVKLSGVENFDIPLLYEEDVKKASDVLKAACEEIKEVDKVEDCEFRGIQEFNDSSMAYRVYVKSNPKYIMGVHRSVHDIIFKHLTDAGIEIPYSQIVLHQSEKK